MALRNSKIVEKLKESFLRVAADKIQYIDSTEEQKELYIKTKYNISDIANFEKELSERIKRLAILESYPKNYDEFTEDEKQKHNEQIYAMNEKIIAEEVYTSANIMDLSRQLYYEYNLTDKNLEKYYKIVYNLWYHLGNGYYYSSNSIVIDQFFDLGIDLYILTGDKDQNSTEFEDKIISAINHFSLECGEDYAINNGEITVTESAESKIHKRLGNIISEVGGRTVLKLLFENELTKLYNSEIDRYIICKNKQLGSTDYNTPIPYNYLIKICFKYLEKPLIISLTKKVEEAYNQLLADSKSYVDLLGVYNPSPFSETTFDALFMIDFIADNTLFENLCIPSQYNRTFLELILKDIYKPEYLKDKRSPKLYQSERFLKLISALLSESYCSIVNYKTLSSKVHVSKSIVEEFLNHFSVNVNDSNANYKNIFSETTLSHKPLVKLDSENYFFLSPQLSGYAFCNTIQDNLHSRELSRGLGNRLDDFTKELLEKKQYLYKYGTYAPKKTNKEGECDLILEDDKRIVFIELKNCGLPYEFETTDLVTILKCLGEGMLKAQKQILHHKLHLIENDNKMELFKDKNDSLPLYTLDSTNKRIYSISLCASEYAFFTSGVIARRLTESLANITFSPYDINRKKELENINKLSKDFRKLIESYSKYKEKLSASDLFFCSSFKTLQQFYIALSLSKNISEFIDFLVFDTYMITPYFDFYAGLLYRIRLKNSNK